MISSSIYPHRNPIPLQLSVESSIERKIRMYEFILYDLLIRLYHLSIRIHRSIIEMNIVYYTYNDWKTYWMSTNETRTLSKACTQCHSDIWFSIAEQIEESRMTKSRISWCYIWDIWMIIMVIDWFQLFAGIINVSAKYALLLCHNAIQLQIRWKIAMYWYCWVIAYTLYGIFQWNFIVLDVE